MTTSLWDTSFLTADVIIVGAGIIGISAAIELVQRDRSLRCVVLERGFSPSGASTRNAGFACFGSLSEIAHDIDHMGREAAFNLVRQRLEGLRILRERCGDDAMGYEEHGGHELFFGDHLALARMDEVNDLLRPLFNADAFSLRNDLIATYGFSDRVTHLIYTPFEGTIDSGCTVRKLWEIAQAYGVHIATGVECQGVNESGSHSVNESKQSGYDLDVVVSGQHYTLHAPHVIVAVNGMFGGVLPELKDVIIPGRGQVLVTEPLGSVPFKGSFHFDEGYYYFRNVGERVLLGGGRNTDFAGERTTSLDTTERLQAHLESLLRTDLLPGSTVPIAHRWAGTMAFTEDKQPRVQELRPGLVVAFGCNGMGVAIGSVISQQAVTLV